ncbi:hypothetical protein MCOR29_003435 [Pyricularia oryzae]|nr:hypothetical protein MCOR29_003435 [Pyricularia oryzae]KAI6403450.1 hypothetical protein MCOR20_007301 [Pyricularia oryzae]
MRLYPRWPLRVETTASYAGVLIPLEEAHLYSHSARSGRTEYEESPSTADNNNDDEAGGKRGGEEAGMLEMRAAEYSIEGLRREVRLGSGGTRPIAYEMKSKLINKAVQDIGMGRYNWQLFFLCGFGWFADNLWMQGVSLLLPSLSAEFGISEKTVRYTTSTLFLGLCVGSFTWGIGSDMMGRRIAFNATLFITGVFGILASYAPSWGWLCLMLAALGSGVGGNLPVDGALFLEFLPDASSSLLTLLSVWWPVGQLCSSLFAWYFMANWPVDQGWRWFVFAIGVVTLLMFALRFFVFNLFESPKFLLSKGRQAEAVAVVHGLAYRNGVKTWLTEKIMDDVAGEDDDDDDDAFASSASRRLALDTTSVLRAKLASFSGDRIRPLFSNKTLGLATAIMWFIWATIGLGYPLFNAFLPQYLSRGVSDSTTGAAPVVAARADTQPQAISAETYRNYAITSIVGVPGSLLAAYTVDHPSPLLGRKGTLAISTLVSAIFLFGFATLGTTPSAQLAFSCIEAFSQNIMYGVLYAFTPEIFPAPVRGAGTGVASFLNRVAGLLAPVLAANIPGDGSTAPIYLSAVLILAAFVGMCLIPIETRGRQRL